MHEHCKPSKQKQQPLVQADALLAASSGVEAQTATEIVPGRISHKDCSVGLDIVWHERAHYAGLPKPDNCLTLL